MTFPTTPRRSVVALTLLLSVGATGCQNKAKAPAKTAVATITLDAPAVGSAQPKVDVLAFIDYECPFSRGQALALLDAVDKHPKEVRLRFFNLPLDVHANSVVGAKGAVAAHRQNNFLGYYKKLMAVPALTRDAEIAWAVEANLDAKKFAADLESSEVAGIVARDVALAKALGVSGTPSFVTNGVLMQGVQSPEVWEKKFAEEIARAEAVLAAGTKIEDLPRQLVAANNPKLAADYNKFVIEGQAAPPQPVPAPVMRASGVASAKIQAAGGANGAVQVVEPIQLGADFADNKTVWHVAVRPDDPRLGPASAPVTMVIFEDMECPFCAKLRPVVAKLVENYAGKLAVVYKHNPLPIHKNADVAAESLEAARAQGKFWPMHDMLLQTQDKLDRESLVADAVKLGLDKGKFETSLAAKGGRDRIEADLEQAAAVGARGTPNIFINGRKLIGAKHESVLRTLIDEEVSHAQELTKGGTAADGIYEAIVGKGKLLDSLGSEVKAIDITEAATRGESGAAIHIVAFEDFQCPFSARLDPHIVEIEKEFPGRIATTWLDFPLTQIHPLAQMLAESGQEARKQGKFWQFHSAIMDDNSKLDEKVVFERAKKAGMDVKALAAAWKAHTWAAAVEKQRKLGETLGVKGTPSVFINGHAFVPQTGFSAGTFRAAVRRLLGTR